MPLRLGPGPVFVYESILGARRWQLYAVRALFVLALLAGLGLVWTSMSEDTQKAFARGSFRELAEVGESFFIAISLVQIAVVLLAAPAATAGAICLDRARGSLAHTLVTDLSDIEIVLGKLSARLAPVFGLVFAGLPVLALASLLGGIIPESLVSLVLISLAMATFGCALALAISVRARKTHEVLMGVYTVWTVWIFSPLVWALLVQLGLVWRLPDWYAKLNPFALAWGPYMSPGWTNPTDLAIFFAATLAGSVCLVGYSVLQLRAEPRGPKRSKAGRIRPTVRERLAALRPSPKLDDNPVLWREWHRNRPSRMVRAVWWLYYLVSAAIAAAIIVSLVGEDDADFYMPLAIFNGFQVTFGLLLVSLTAPTTLAEERVRGGLDVLLATPLSTASIVWAMWRAAYGKVSGLVVIPCFCSCLVAMTLANTGHFGRMISGGVQTTPFYLHDRVILAMLPVAVLLAHGAVITSLGLVLAVWVPKVGRALAISVTVFLALCIGPLFLVDGTFLRQILLALGLPDKAEEVVGVCFGMLSPPAAQILPFLGLIEALDMGRRTAWLAEGLMIVPILGFAAVMYGLTLLSFNRCLGRVPERPRTPGIDPARRATTKVRTEPEIVGVG